MKIIVGLGNPGEEYANSRHNTGWSVVDKIIQKIPAKGWSASGRKFNAETCETIIKDEKVILVKPLTFMNASGKAVKAILKYINDYELWVIHDDMDILFGEIKIVKNKQSAGHKGVESIINELGTQDFIRFRIGVGKPNINQKDFVLAKPVGQEKEIFEKSINKATELVLYALEKGIENAMNKYNSKKENA